MFLKLIYNRSPVAYRMVYRIRKFFRRMKESELQKHIRERKNTEYLLISATNCGRTWLRVLIGRTLQLNYQLHASDLNLHDLYSLSELNPNIPRIKANHEHYEALGSYKDYKVILLVRDPRDAIVSRYMQKYHAKNSKWDDISQYVLESQELERDYIAFYNNWMKGKSLCQDFLLVRYEDLKRDTTQELKQIFTFLNIDIADRIFNDAVEYGSFKNMRKIELEGSSEVRAGVLNPQGKDNPQSLKVRKGQVGGYRQYFSNDVNQKLDDKIEQNLDSSYGY